MRDINKVLKLFTSSTYTMEYVNDFDAIKSILEYCDSNVKPLLKIQFRGGNEESFKQMNKRMLMFLEKNGYVDPEDNNSLCSQFDNELRKITFFMILNTDASFKFDLKEDNTIAHVLNVTPQMPKCVLINLLYDLNMEKYFFECIKYAPSWFVIQFIDAAVAALKYYKPHCVLEKVEGLISAICVNISRMDVRDTDEITKKIILGKFYDHIMDILRQFYTPDAEKFTDFSIKQFNIYFGYAVRRILNMVLFTFDLYESRPIYEVDKMYKLYEICLQKNRLVKLNDANAEYSGLIRESLRKIIMALLNSLQYCALLISVDLFMLWVEVDCNEKQTLQAIIGENAYKVLERMNSNRELAHGVKEQLNFIAIRPRSIEELAAEATIGTLLLMLDSSNISKEEKAIWFNEFVRREELVFENDECVKALSECSDLLNEEILLTIIDYLLLTCEDHIAENSKLVIKAEDEQYTELRNLVVRSLKNLTWKQVENLVFHMICNDYYSFYLYELAEFEERSTRFLDYARTLKIWSYTDLNEFLKLCFENAVYMCRKLIEKACKCKNILNGLEFVLKNCQKIHKFFGEYGLSTLQQNYLYEQYYVDILAAIGIHKCVKSEELYHNFFLKNISENLLSSNCTLISKFIMALSKIVAKTDDLPFDSVTVIKILLQLAHIIEYYRWKIDTFSQIKVEIVSNTIELILQIESKFTPTDSGINIFRDRIEKYSPKTLYYFQKYLMGPEDKLLGFTSYLIRDRKGPSEMQILLSDLISTLTLNEIQSIGNNKSLRTIVPNAFSTLADTITEYTNIPSVMMNYRHCMKGYSILTNILLNDPNIGKGVALYYANSIMKTINKSPKELQEEIFIDFQLILLKIFKIAEPYKQHNVEEILQIIKDKKWQGISSFKLMLLAGVLNN